MDAIFIEISAIIIVASILNISFRYLRQPPILAYIATGVLLGPAGFFHLQNQDSLKTLGQLGITFLLFMLGLELKLKELRSIGKTAVLAGTLQMGLTFVLGFVLSLMLGFSNIVSIYIAIALSFSSTIIIVKLLSDKKDINSLHGKLALGILLMQDFFAVMTIIFLTSISGESSKLILQILLVFLKSIVLFGWIIVLSKYLFPRVLHSIARSSESLFLFSLAWVFALTAVVTSPLIGFSIEIGGFLAGLALAESAENYQIVARMKALRDFFITIFFVMLGLEMKFTSILSLILPALIFSFFVIILKPAIVMLITGLMGFRKRTSFFVGISLAQISEFSLIILFIGNQKGVISNEVTTLFLIVAMITFVGSTYLIQGTNKIYRYFSHYLSFLELRQGKHSDFVSSNNFKLLENHVIIVGGHQMGQSILHALKNTEEKILVVDFDPDIVKRLQDKEHHVIFGDISDPEIQERVGFEKAKLVISTVPDLEDNLLLIEGLLHKNKKATIVVMAYEAEDAKALYKAGADYVVLPHLAGGHHLAKILISNNHLEIIEKFKAKDMEYLQ